MLEHVEKISSIIIKTSGVWIPPLGLFLLYAIPKIYPKSDKYFQTAYVTLEEVDDITDAILEEYPNIDWINTFDDIVNQVTNVLAKKYDLDEDEKEKVQQRVKAKMKKDEGISIDWDNGEGKINFKKDF